MDFIALLTGILGGGMGVAYYSFICKPYWLYTYYAVIGTTYPIVIKWTYTQYKRHVSTSPLTPKDGFPEFAAPLAVFNMVSWISVLAVDKALLTEYHTIDEFKHAWSLSAMCPCLLVLGAAFQKFNIPERFMPHDAIAIIGHSHQIWHLCGMSIMWIWIHAITAHHNARAKYGCLP